MSLRTYYDFAENDRNYFEKSVEFHLIANNMASLAQNTCEKYLKHIVDIYYLPETPEEQGKKERILKTHSLNRLIKFLKDEMLVDIDIEKKAAILGADGYYFSARYPGDDSIEVDESDIDFCQKAVSACKEETDRIISEMNSREISDIEWEEK